MNFKLNALVAAAVMAASVPAFAGMAGATSGNGELLLNLRFYNGAQNAGGDDISAVFDLGVTMDDFLAHKNEAGFSMNWNLNALNYGTAFADVLAFAGANAANIEYNVIALDSTNPELAGGHRYLTTGVATSVSIVNNAVAQMSGMDVYVTANNVRGTHDDVDHGASTAVQADSSAVNPVYFGAVNGPMGDTWRNITGVPDSTAKLGVAQNFWLLTTSSLSNTAQATKQPFGVDLNGNNTITGTEFGKWNVLADGTVTFSNPAPVPEASTYGMMLAGLGLVGFMARRRMNRAA
jgi:predicted secreted protein